MEQLKEAQNITTGIFNLGEAISKYIQICSDAYGPWGGLLAILSIPLGITLALVIARVIYNIVRPA